jgi:membrane protein
VKNPVEPLVRRYEQVIERARSRSRAFDHLWRAKDRYGECMGGRLAAGIAYYAFFAAFALAFVAFSILGYALGTYSELEGTVAAYLDRNLPQLEVEQIRQPRGTFAVIGFVGLVLIGVRWVEGLRSSQRLIWGLDQQPGNPVVRRLVDLGMLAGLGLLWALSLWLAGSIERFLTPALGWIGAVLGWAVNLVAAAALLAAVPRLRMPARRLLPPALLVATGISLLTTAGQVIVRRTEDNPAYQVVSSVAGLLLFLYLFSQLLLFAAAFAATGGRGPVRDLATEAVMTPDPDSSFTPKRGGGAP